MSDFMSELLKKGVEEPKSGGTKFRKPELGTHRYRIDTITRAEGDAMRGLPPRIGLSLVGASEGAKGDYDFTIWVGGQYDPDGSKGMGKFAKLVQAVFGLPDFAQAQKTAVKIISHETIGNQYMRGMLVDCEVVEKPQKKDPSKMSTYYNWAHVAGQSADSIKASRAEMEAGKAAPKAAPEPEPSQAAPEQPQPAATAVAPAPEAADPLAALGL